MDWSALRRIVTDESAGRSRILIDGAPANVLAMDEAGLAEIWTAALDQAAIFDGGDRLKDAPVRLEPDPGAVKVRWFTVPVEDPDQSPEEREAAAAAGFAACGASEARVDTSRHPMMHKTDTLDVIIPVRGEIDLLLDDGPPARLKPGDVVIQRATNHAWVNKGAETALLIAILINVGADS